MRWAASSMRSSMIWHLVTLTLPELWLSELSQVCSRNGILTHPPSYSLLNKDSKTLTPHTAQAVVWSWQLRDTLDECKILVPRPVCHFGKYDDGPILLPFKSIQFLPRVFEKAFFFFIFEISYFTELCILEVITFPGRWWALWTEDCLDFPEHVLGISATLSLLSSGPSNM